MYFLRIFKFKTIEDIFTVASIQSNQVFHVFATLLFMWVEMIEQNSTNRIPIYILLMNDNNSFLICSTKIIGWIAIVNDYKLIRSTGKKYYRHCCCYICGAYSFILIIKVQSSINEVNFKFFPLIQSTPKRCIIDEILLKMNDNTAKYHFINSIFIDAMPVD